MIETEFYKRYWLNVVETFVFFNKKGVISIKNSVFNQNMLKLYKIK
ncbi:protein of unknown function [Streptococcus thermophilus]|uniref:Uncharacterized protein n=1 Tax=Streptococcus thermophilus TaxID=1308 RepID=A0AAU9HER7_STRTR|nr:protein of unknown function [Streptococcus thermophilus]CAD0125427.1 protein of unknown function [Streptococcus thermophilus]CAD0129391.1 protein of unknown function [Streptococcus thermophilus]CAD0153826.1 protein of unknown function [Streptococcus thermophilus]CAD0160213.1 protein of unknown function [Streptococcus thermophilus]